jgi:integrase
LLSVALPPGRRAAELAGLRWGDVRIEGDLVHLTWRRCKGGKTMQDRLPRAVSIAFLCYIRAVYGDDLRTLHADSPVWVSLARNASKGPAISTQAISDVCKKRLGTSQVHTLRHTFAHTMEEAGAKVSEIQARLGHTSLAVTGRYLASLKSAVNSHGDQLARLFGVEE